MAEWFQPAGLLRYILYDFTRWNPEDRTYMWNFELLLENRRRSADPLPFQADIYFDTIGDFNEGDVAIHAVVFAIEGHCAVDAPGG